MSGGVEGLFLVISHTFPIYKQLSTQGTITSCSLNKLYVKNHWVLRDLENPQALSSALAALRRYSPGPSSFLNPVEPWFLTSNYYRGHESKSSTTPRTVASPVDGRPPEKVLGDYRNIGTVLLSII